MKRRQKPTGGLSRRDVLKYGLYGGLASGLSSSLWLSGCRKQHIAKEPNIIFILVDTLRADRMGLYGHYRNTTPTIDAIGSEGVVFDRAIAPAPWTQPSVASMFCSRHPSVHKVLDYKLARDMRWGDVERIAVFGDPFITIAEVLRDHGYETAGFIANFLVSSYYGFSQGFNHYADMPYRKQKVGDMSGDKLNSELLAWLRQRNRYKPLFLYLHYMDVHGPYYARPEFCEPLFKQVEQMSNKRRLSVRERRGAEILATRQAAEIVAKHRELSNYLEFWSAFYDAGVRELDQHIADLRAGLMQMGLWNDSYVLITADHGEELLEHGYWDHGHSVYHTELHVPLILRWPGVLPRGKRVGGTVHLNDLMPTLLDQLQLPAVTGMQGISLVSDIAGNPPKHPVAAFSEAVKHKPYNKSLSLGDWKLIVEADRTEQELYNIADDPKEQRNLYALYPTKVKQLSELLKEQEAINRRLASKTKGQQVPVTPEEYERLKSLGYVK